MKGEEKEETYFFLFHESFQGNSSLCQLVRNYFISLRLVRLLANHLLMAGCYSPLVRPAHLTFPALLLGRKSGNFAKAAVFFFPPRLPFSFLTEWTETETVRCINMVQRRCFMKSFDQCGFEKF